MVIGRIVGPFGVRGELKVELHTDFPDRFNGLSRVFVGKDRRPIDIERSRRHGGQVVLKIAGIDRPEGVEPLREQDVLVLRDEAVELPEGHFFLEDVVGMQVLSVDGAQLGTISDVLQTGANEVFVVTQGSATILIPSTREAVRSLDLENRKLVVEAWILEPPD